MDPETIAALNRLSDRLSRHSDSVEQRLDGLQLSVTKAEHQATLAAMASEGARREASEAATQAAQTNGRVRALEIWKASIEGGAKVINVQTGLLLGSGVLLAIALFVAGRTL